MSSVQRWVSCPQPPLCLLLWPLRLWSQWCWGRFASLKEREDRSWAVLAEGKLHRLLKWLASYQAQQKWAVSSKVACLEALTAAGSAGHNAQQPALHNASLLQLQGLDKVPKMPWIWHHHQIHLFKPFNNRQLAPPPDRVGTPAAILTFRTSSVQKDLNLLSCTSRQNSWASSVLRLTVLERVVSLAPALSPHEDPEAAD